MLETGLGGRLDATNVIKDPLVSVICSISLDHTQILGSTEEAIALEKAGIIKKTVPARHILQTMRKLQIFLRISAGKGTLRFTCRIFQN